MQLLLQHQSRLWVGEGIPLEISHPRSFSIPIESIFIAPTYKSPTSRGASKDPFLFLPFRASKKKNLLPHVYFLQPLLYIIRKQLTEMWTVQHRRKRNTKLLNSMKASLWRLEGGLVQASNFPLCHTTGWARFPLKLHHAPLKAQYIFEQPNFLAFMSKQ